MNPYNIAILCFGFCSLLLGLLICLKRQDEIGKRYFLMSLVHGGWAIFIAINLNNDVSPELGLFMGRLANGFAVFIPVTWYHFIATYIGKVNERRNFIRSLYAMDALIACFAFSPWFIPKVVPMVGFKYYSQAGSVFLFFAITFLAIILSGFYELYQKMRVCEGYEKRQLKWLFWISLVGYIGGCPTFFPVLGISIPQFALLLLPLYPFGLTYIMIKQKLFDVEELVRAAHRDKLTAIGVLAASINHEVKNPLFIIKGLAESCLERQREGIFPTDKKALESSNDAMKRSIEQADRAMDIIKRLSLFAKAGIEGEMKFESVSVSEVLENILPLVRYELAAHSVTLTRDIPKDLPAVYVDRRYLEEIFFNLIVNAIQALKSAKKSGEIKINAITEGASVSVRISDSGPGIPADKLKDVFRPFYTTKAEGTGLGLYITQQLVEKVKGRISVDSKQGTGTTFKVLLRVNNS